MSRGETTPGPTSGTAHRPQTPKDRERERERTPAGREQRVELMEGPTRTGLLKELAKVIKKPGHRSRKQVRQQGYRSTRMEEVGAGRGVRSGS